MTDNRQQVPFSNISSLFRGHDSSAAPSQLGYVAAGREPRPDYDLQPGASNPGYDAFPRQRSHVTGGRASGLAYMSSDVMQTFLDDVELPDNRGSKTEINFRSPGSSRPSKSAPRCPRACVITLSVLVSIIIAGLVAIVTLLLLGPCYNVTCVHGYCDWTGATVSNPVCKCEATWMGEQCDQAVAVTQTENVTGLAFSWDHVATSDSDRGWRLIYNEALHYPDEQSKYTLGTDTQFSSVKLGETYEIHVQSINWDHKLLLVHHEHIQVQNTARLDVTWTNTTGSDRGFLVRASRFRKERSGDLYLEVEVRSLSVEDLDPCTAYRMTVYTVKQDLSEEMAVRFIQETDCPVAAIGWREGDSVVLGGWSGGAVRLLSSSHCGQSDAFPLPVRSPSCLADEAAGKVGEAISTAASHTGNQSWHYKRGHHRSAHGSGCPYSPPLQTSAGRTVGETADDIVDGFYARLWLRATNSSGDGSSIEIAGGDDAGDDRVSTMVFVTADQSGIQMNTYDCHWDRCVQNNTCGDDYFAAPLVSNLSLTEWHLLELTLQAGSSTYDDRWTYKVNGVELYTAGAYLNAWTFENYGNYKYVNRLKFKPRNADVKDVTKLGFFFDDVRYEAFSWTKRDEIRGFYETSFER